MCDQSFDVLLEKVLYHQIEAILGDKFLISPPSFTYCSVGLLFP